MGDSSGTVAAIRNDYLIRHTKILKALNRLIGQGQLAPGHDEIMIRCGEILLAHSDYRAIMICRTLVTDPGITPLALLCPAAGPDANRLTVRREPAALDCLPASLVENVLQTRASSIAEHLVPLPGCPETAENEVLCSCGAWPLLHQQQFYGILVIFTAAPDSFDDRETAFLESCSTDIAIQLHSHGVNAQLQLERDFNTEIIDTIQALMVSITPCGKIVRFNLEAEKVTGFSEREVLDSYWVDILLAPENRLAYQKLVSDLLGRTIGNINFRAELETKTGDRRTIEWHSSIKPDINHGTIGMVLFGLDITERLLADKAYNSAVARWENIFCTIQDPALIATRDGIILDANHATFTAARKSREEVIGQSVCKILHGSTTPDHRCPLEQLLMTGNSRILHTDLGGLHGDFLLTLSPCRAADSSEEVTLIVARDTTEEEQLRAEAMRAAQLASIGELAAGVAHEINNPINGILNYAQMLSDLELDGPGQDITRRIISESRRIEGIVRNLLDFSRNRIEAPEPVSGAALVEDCITLVGHQLQKEDILVKMDFPAELPLAFCNASQIKQVILNILSNSRHALNQKFPKPDKDKKISIKGRSCLRKNTPYLRITITDRGTGIEHQVLERIFDPFFSTKPNGEGTGLGLSISYGLMRDNGGYIRVTSENGQYTRTTLDLPIVGNGGGNSHVQ